MKIEWASSFGPDGSRRKPRPSTMHGWLAKMRGTLLGDEDLRSKGMREMKAAKTWRKMERDRAKRAKDKQSIFSFFSSKKKSPPRPPQRANTLQRSRPSSSRRSTQLSVSSSRRPPMSSRPSNASRRPSQQSSRPPSTRRLNRR